MIIVDVVIIVVFIAALQNIFHKVVDVAADEGAVWIHNDKVVFVVAEVNNNAHLSVHVGADLVGKLVAIGGIQLLIGRGNVKRDIAALFQLAVLNGKIDQFVGDLGFGFAAAAVAFQQFGAVSVQASERHHGALPVEVHADLWIDRQHDGRIHADIAAVIADAKDQCGAGGDRQNDALYLFDFCGFVFGFGDHGIGHRLSDLVTQIGSFYKVSVFIQQNGITCQALHYKIFHLADPLFPSCPTWARIYS